MTTSDQSVQLKEPKPLLGELSYGTILWWTVGAILLAIFAGPVIGWLSWELSGSSPQPTRATHKTVEQRNLLPDTSGWESATVVAKPSGWTRWTAPDSATEAFGMVENGCVRVKNSDSVRDICPHGIDFPTHSAGSRTYFVNSLEEYDVTVHFRYKL